MTIFSRLAAWWRAWVCRNDFHNRYAVPYMEHGCIDGPPRHFAIIKCHWCDLSVKTRDEVWCARAWRSYSDPVWGTRRERY